MVMIYDKQVRLRLSCRISMIYLTHMINMQLI